MVAMLDIFARAFRHPIDYSGVLRTVDLTFQEQIREADTIYSFIFTADRLPSWKAGQHAIFTLPDRPVTGKSWRPFSIASAPHEGVIRIGTTIPDPHSSFKQELLTLRPGDRVRMHGPYGELYLRPRMKRVVGIAGGIGITPFRSILCDLSHRQSATPLTLIYSAKDNGHVYRPSLEEWCGANPALQIVYTATPEEVNAALAAEVAAHGNEAHYLLSGSPGMIAALTKTLRETGIRPNHIVNDPFKGY